MSGGRGAPVCIEPLSGCCEFGGGGEEFSDDELCGGEFCGDDVDAVLLFVGSVEVVEGFEGCGRGAAGSADASLAATDGSARAGEDGFDFEAGVAESDGLVWAVAEARSGVPG